MFMLKSFIDILFEQEKYVWNGYAHQFYACQM